MAQSTVKLIVDAQNAIKPLQRVNEQTKALSKSTDKLKGRLEKNGKQFNKFGNNAKKASVGVGALTKTVRNLVAAFAVIQTAKFIFFKTAELETQRKSLEQLTGSLEETNKIISELQEFGAVTPFTSAELIEQTKRLKAFGFETEELVETTKRLSDVAGATGADLTGIATAFGQIRAKGKLQQEENLQLLERGVNITNELKRITKLQGDEFESAMRKGEIGADLVNQALINLTNEGAIFAGGATKQADTLNGKLSTLQDTIDTLARTIGEELEDEIKGILDLSIKAVKQISELIESIGLVNKLGKKDMVRIEVEAREFATQEVSKDFNFIQRRFNKEARKDFQKIFNLKKKELITNALTTKELTKQEKKQKEIEKTVEESKNLAKEHREQTEGTNDNLDKATRLTDIQRKHHIQIVENERKKIDLQNKKNKDFEDFIADQENSNRLLQASINGDASKVILQMEINKAVKKYGEENRDIITKLLTSNSLLQTQKTEAEKLRTVFAGIGQEIKQGIVENLREAIKGSQSFGDALSNVLDRVGDKILDSGLNILVDGLTNTIQGKSNKDQKFGGALGTVAGSFLGPIGGIVGGTLGRLLPFANGGRPPVGQASIVGERGPELFVPDSAGTIIPNNKLGVGDNITNIVNVSVDASGSSVSGNGADAKQLGAVIGAAVQAQLIREKRSGGLLAR